MADLLSLRERIQEITDSWFLREAALFSIFCTQELRSNPDIQISVRTGRGRIEYNEEMLAQFTTVELEELLRVEMIRLLLKHPFERQPQGSRAEALHGGSDLVISQFYTPQSVKILSLKSFNLPSGQSFEWYIGKLNLLSEPFAFSLDEESYGMSSNPCESKEYTELWEEDDEQCQEINYLITNSIHDWGTFSGQLVETIKAGTKGKIDYRYVLSGFRASVISSKRQLTRMKPSRRFGWEYMGSKFELSTKLLVAIDVSGSISSETISYFLRIIQRFFKYGISDMDIIQFDTEVKDEVMTLKEYSKHLNNYGLQVVGRGGTSFQSVFDYLKEHNHYDGLVIFTDGYAAKPSLDFYSKAKVLWVLESEESYKKRGSELQTIGRVCTMSL